MGPAVVLLVSRDEDILTIFGAALRKAGFGVRELREPAAVLDSVKAERPSLVVTNFPTRAVGELTVTELLRHDPGTASIPILNVTSHVLPEEIDRAAAAGVSASMHMPVALSRFVAEVRRIVDATRADA